MLYSLKAPGKNPSLNNSSWTPPTPRNRSTCIFNVCTPEHADPILGHFARAIPQPARQNQISWRLSRMRSRETFRATGLHGRVGVGADTRSHESLSRTNHCGANNNKLYATIYPLQSVLWIVKNGYRSERQRKLSGVKDDLSLVASEVNTSGRLNGNDIRDTDWMKKCLEIGLVVVSYFNRLEIILNQIWK